MVKFTKTKKVNASADKVWEIFAHGFNDAHLWMAAVPHSYAKANGESFDGAQSDGRVCELSSKQNGIKASEKFLAYNEENKTATVQVDFLNTPFLFPVKFNTLAFSIRETGDNQSEMSWEFKAHIKPLGLIFMASSQIGLREICNRYCGRIKILCGEWNPSS